MRRDHVPWRAAGATSERQRSADDMVREAGWVFNNRTGRDLSLAEFVETGNHETLAYLTAFGLADDQLASQTLVEIGVDLSKMYTIGDLQGGIEEAERLLGFRVTRSDEG